MKVDYKENKKELTIEHGDLVRINGKFYIVFQETEKGYRLNNLSGIGYFGCYQGKEELAERLQDMSDTIEVFSKDKYQLQITKV